MFAVANPEVKSRMALRPPSPAMRFMMPKGRLPGSPFIGRHLRIDIRHTLATASRAIELMIPRDRVPGSPITNTVAKLGVKPHHTLRPSNPANPTMAFGSMNEMRDSNAVARTPVKPTDHLRPPEPGQDRAEIRSTAAGLTFHSGGHENVLA